MTPRTLHRHVPITVRRPGQERAEATFAPSRSSRRRRIEIGLTGLVIVVVTMLAVSL